MKDARSRKPMIRQGMQRRENALRMPMPSLLSQDPHRFTEINDHQNNQIHKPNRQINGSALDSYKKLQSHKSFSQLYKMSMIYTPSSNALINTNNRQQSVKRASHSKNNLILTSSSFINHNTDSCKNMIVPNSYKEKNIYRSQSKDEKSIRHTQSNSKQQIKPLKLDLSYDENNIQKILREKISHQNLLHADSSHEKINKNERRRMLCSSMAENEKEVKRAMLKMKKEIVLNTNSTLPESSETNPLSNTFNISMAKNLKNSIIFVNSDADSIEDMHSVLVGFYQRTKKMTEKLELEKAYCFEDQTKTLIEIEDDMLMQSLI